MALTSYQFRNQPYWLGFVFAGQAFTASFRETIMPGASLCIQISTGENMITHLTNRAVISQGEQLGIKLIKSPHFVPGRMPIPVVNLDDRSRIKPATSLYAYATNICGGTILEESMVPSCGCAYGAAPIESSFYERVLQYKTNYVLAITNEGFCPTNVLMSIAFYESEN